MYIIIMSIYIQLKTVWFEVIWLIPQVLLFGNGLYRSYGENSWDDFLNSLSKDNKKTVSAGKLESPMFLRSQLLSGGSIDCALKDAGKGIFGTLGNNALRGNLKKLLTAGFDDILTTNYDYRLEIAAADKETVTKYYLDKNARNILKGKAVEPKYMLHSYQNVDCNGVNNRIWHIHGEAKKQDSMILSLYYYSNLLSRIVEYAKNNRNRYKDLQGKHLPVEIQSWIDSFILGDVYVLGFGFDYSEIDLWWLLERKKKEKANHGRLYFYEPVSVDSEKCRLLKLFGAEVVNLGYDVADKSEKEKKNIYSEFYPKAIDSIIKKVEKKRKTEAGK